MRTTQRLLTPGWVAGSVRARQMLLRRVGRARARSIAGADSLGEALARLTGTAYGRAVMPGMDLAAAQRAIAETTLWHVRVLAGWAPSRALEPIRTLVAWYELANIEDRLAYVRGATVPRPYALGALADVWPRTSGAQTTGELRAELTGSTWGAPGTDDPPGIELALRFAWARRVLDAVEEAGDWAAGAVSLLLARELLIAGRPAAELLTARPPGVGTGWTETSEIAALRDRLPRSAAWVLAGVQRPADLWEAEVTWWRRVESDAEQLARSPLLGRPALIGSIALLGVDAWRTAAALEVAARGGGGVAMEVFEDIA